MLSLQQVKKILNNPNISDDEALEIRDGFRSLVEIIYEQWEKEKINTNQKNYGEQEAIFLEENQGHQPSELSEAQKTQTA